MSTADNPPYVVAFSYVPLAIREDRLSLLLVRSTLASDWGLPHIDVAEYLDRSTGSDLDEDAAIAWQNSTNLENVSLKSVGHRSGTKGRRGISLVYRMLIPAEPERVMFAEHDATWMPISEQLDLPFTESSHLEFDGFSTDLHAIAELLPKEFKLSDLQSAAELVRLTLLPSTSNQRPEVLDTRNFRRQISEADWLEETGTVSRGAHRPAKLYRLKS